MFVYSISCLLNKNMLLTIWLQNVSLFIGPPKNLPPKTPTATGFFLHKAVNATFELVEVYPNSETIPSSQQDYLIACY